MTVLAKITLAAALLLSIAVPFGAFAAGEKTKGRYKTAIGVNVFLFIATIGVAAGLMFTGHAFAAEETAKAVNSAAGWGYLAAALSTGMSCLGGGIAVQHRMAFQGEYFVDRYGKDAVKHTPPVAKMLAADVPVGLGTDATRVASYNPWTALYWLVSGRTVGGMAMYDDNNRLPRDVALELWTAGSAWFSSEQGKKGRIEKDQLADLVVLSKDYFSVPEEEIKGIESVMTIVDGKVVYAAGHFTPLAPPAIPVVPDWSPVVKVPGHYRSAPPAAAKIGAMVQMHQCCGSCGVHGHQHDIARKSAIPVSDDRAFWGALGCSCFAF